jgi:predicted dehydrogenase
MAEAEAKLPASERIDFVSIVTPNKSHFSVAKIFLQQGFHVVCDKPMTYTLEEARELVELVEKTKRVFALTHNYTGTPVVRHVRQMFEDGKLGKVRKVIVEYLQDFLTYPHEKEGMKQAVWRVDPQQSGLGGTLGDIGSHAFNLMEYITGDPVIQLCAEKTTFLPDRVLDEDVNVLLRFKGGGKGTLIASQIAMGEENNLNIRIYTEKAGIHWEQENPNYLRIDWYEKPRQILARGNKYLSKPAKDASRVPSGHPEGYLEAFANIYCGAIEAIRASIDGKPLNTASYDFPTVYDGYRGMAFITKAVESSNAGAIWVDL